MSYELQTLEWPPKAAPEVVDYSLDWEEAPQSPVDAERDYVPVLQQGETITAVAHSILAAPPGDEGSPLTIDSEGMFAADRKTFVFLSGGVIGTYAISCTITTSGDRTYWRRILLSVYA